MAAGSDVPADVLDSATLIQSLKTKTYLSRSEKEAMNRARLKIAFWACRTENIMPSRENLTYILGQDAPDIMGAYDKYLETESEKSETAAKEKGGKRTKGGTQFWGGAQ